MGKDKAGGPEVERAIGPTGLDGVQTETEDERQEGEGEEEEGE